MVLAQFDYIFAIAMLFAFLDAWNIGANDVANSFASSVSSRSLKYWQAMVLAGICEFLGAVLVGSRVSDTIRSKIVDVQVFSDEPAVLMLTMTCALVGSSTWLTIATSIGMPVSTTHSIVGAVIGSSIAARGAKNIRWGWDGVSQIIASWFIAPLIAGAFSSIIFLISKYGVLEVKDINKSIRNALLLVPVMVFATFSILTMLIVWKGSPSLHLDDLSTGATVGAIFGVGGVALILYMLFFYPVFARKIQHNDWTLKWYSVLWGPIYWFKPVSDIPPMPAGHQLVIDYYEGRRYGVTDSGAAPVETSSVDSQTKEHPIDVENVAVEVQSNSVLATEEKSEQSTRQLWWSLFKQGPKQWPYLFWLVISHGFTKDIINSQVMDKDMLTGDLQGMHSKSKYYDNRVEFLYSLLQAITASTMSFAHGANDIANATGPLATVYLVWRSNTISSKADVPVWVLCYAAGALVIGCWTYGYNIMRNLGNKLILQSPSRGFSIEIGAAVTTVMATQLAIPISTTQSAVGATVFVGLMNMDLKGVNWRMVIWCYLGWVVTLPVAGIIAGLLNAIILHAPRDGGDYTMRI
ncbi:phosphate permease Pho89p [[Candida] railenensis]|uniref:Phosphate transporter n=1 Tax=[Candida] railenensis TaxID=45579 RepID=A0A9P0QU73_9ASCO|nr:phosphate permease Pho89p [[Candida] railenensis]